MTATPGSLTRAARSGMRWSAVNTLGSAALQFVQVVVLARLIGPDDFGRMAVVVALLGIGTTFAEMGLSSALIQRANPARREIATLYSVNISMGALLFALSWITAPLIQTFYRMDELGSLVRAAAGIFIIAPAGQIYRAQLQKQLEFRVLTVINLASLAAATLLAVGLALRGAGVWSLVIGYLAGEVLTAVGLVVAGVRRGYWAGLAWDLAGVRGYLAFGGLRVAAMIANAVNSRIDQLVIGRLMGATPLGLYSVAHRIAMEPVQRINPIVTQVAFPVLAIVQHDQVRLQRGYLRMIGAVMAVNAPLMIGLAATAPLVVRVFLGPQWSDAAVLLAVLACYSLFRSIGNASGALVLAAGRADWSLYWNLALLLVVPAIVLVAARSEGSIVAVAAALTTMQLALLIAHYFFFVRRIAGPCGRAYAAVLAKPLLCAALMVVALRLLASPVKVFVPLAQLAVLVIAGATVYAACSYAWQRDVTNELLAMVWSRRHGDTRA